MKFATAASVLALIASVSAASINDANTRMVARPRPHAVAGQIAMRQESEGGGEEPKPEDGQEGGDDKGGEGPGAGPDKQCVPFPFPIPHGPDGPPEAGPGGDQGGKGPGGPGEGGHGPPVAGPPFGGKPPFQIPHSGAAGVAFSSTAAVGAAIAAMLL